MISRINNSVKAKDIIQEVDVLKAISWIKFARRKVSNQTVITCFHKCRFWKERHDLQVLDQEEEEEFVNLVKEPSSNVSLPDYIDFDMEVATSQFLAGVESIAWREESR